MALSLPLPSSLLKLPIRQFKKIMWAMALMKKTMKQHVKNTICLVSPPSSVKQQRQMSIFQVLETTRLCNVKFLLKKINNNCIISAILTDGKIYGKKIVLDSG